MSQDWLYVQAVLKGGWLYTVFPHRETALLRMGVDKHGEYASIGKTERTHEIRFKSRVKNFCKNVSFLSYNAFVSYLVCRVLL